MYRNYNKRNKEKIATYQKRYVENNKKAICIICGKPAPIKFCSKECMGIGMVGKNNYFYVHGKSKNPYSSNWNERFRKSIRDRDNNICMRCRKPREVFKKTLAIHHIDGNPQNTIKENCVSLCNSCHGIVEGSGKKIEVFEPLFQKMLSKLYGYEYGKEVKK